MRWTTTRCRRSPRGHDDLRRVRVDARALVAFAKPLACEGCYAFCLETLEQVSVAQARGFFPGIGITEDPATGSAAGPLGAYLVQRNLAPANEWFTIVQGDALRRPSRIEVCIGRDEVGVGGSCIIVNHRGRRTPFHLIGERAELVRRALADRCVRAHSSITAADTSTALRISLGSYGANPRRKPSGRGVRNTNR